MADEEKERPSSSEKQEEAPREGAEIEEGEGQPDPEAEKKAEALKKEHEVMLANEKRRREEISARELANRERAESEFRRRKERREGGSDEGEEEKPLTVSQLEVILARERERTTKELLGSQIAEKVKRIAVSDEHAALIMEIHRNRSFPAHLTLEEQLEEAAAIVDRKRVIAQNQELKRALAGKKTTQRSAGETAHPYEVRDGEPKMPPQDLQSLRSAGFSWDGIKKLYKKPLPGSKKTLWYDPAKKRRWTE